IADQAACTPEAIALVCEEEQLTYAHLEQRSTRLASALRQRGVGPEVPVALLLERGLDLVISVLATLKAGGCYVPLEPSLPAHRLSFMLAQSQPQVLVCHTHLLADLPSHSIPVVCLDTDWASLMVPHTELPADSVSLEQNAYVIYTSGS